MPDHQLLVYFHILLMVFWLGTDLGVYIAGLYFIDPKLTLDQRRTAIGIGLAVDRYPRLCFVAILPVGMQLAWNLGLLPWGSGFVTAVWLYAAVWLFVVVQGMRHPAAGAPSPWARIERVFQVVSLVGLVGAGLWFLAQGAAPGWLAGKFLALGAICLFAILLDRSFGPTLVAFGAIAEQGSNPEREAILKRNMNVTYVWVLAIYAALLVAGYLGTVKP
jgi:hypothetical protein